MSLDGLDANLGTSQAQFLEIFSRRDLKVPDSKGGQANFLLVRKSQFHKLLVSFSSCKSANYLSVPVRESQIRIFYELPVNRKFLRCARLLTADPQIYDTSLQHYKEKI
jgi:hypothetical protein